MEVVDLRKLIAKISNNLILGSNFTGAFEGKKINIMGISERKEREKDRRKQQLIVAARRCFKRQGYRATSMKDIGSEADLSSGTIYLYFKNKQDLYAAVLINVLEYLRVRFLHVSQQTRTNLEGRIDALLDIITEAFCQEPEFTTSLFLFLSNQKHIALSADNCNHLSAVFSVAKEIVDSIFKARSEDASDSLYPAPGILSDLFWSASIGVAILENGKSNLFDSPLDIKSKLEMTFDILKKGMHQFGRCQVVRPALNVH